ncbi:unnamed protein product, partial [marine sediment metagenome]
DRWLKGLTPWQSLAGLGQTAAGQTANLGMQTGQGLAQNALAAGEARASGYINQANVISGAATSGVENSIYANYLNKMRK